MTEIEDMAERARQIVANPAAIISIRDTDSRYVYVDDAWLVVSGTTRESVLDRRLNELPFIPHNEASRFMEEDRQAIQLLHLVVINTYQIGQTTLRFLSVRVFKNDCVLEVSFALGPIIISAYGWSSERLERSFGEDLANRLLADPQLMDSIQIDLMLRSHMVLC